MPRKIKKILFFVSSPFCERDYKRYGMDIFSTNNFDIYVWDITFALYPELKGRFFPSDPIQWKNHITFNSKKDILIALNACTDDVFIINTVAYNLSTFKIYRAISKKNIPYSINSACFIPPLSIILNRKEKFLKALKIFDYKKLKSYIIKKIPLKIFRMKPALFVIAEGSKCNIKRSEVTSKTKVLRTHALDYDIYLASDKTTKKNGTAVFLDNYLPFHTDGLFSGEKSPVTPEIYYKELCYFFNFLEKKHNLKIIIAAHPRSQYEKMPDFFEGRSIIKGESASLTRNANLIITNFSTSISFAVLYKKPICFFTTNEICENNTKSPIKFDYKNYILNIANALGSTCTNISKDITDNHEINFNVNEEKYKQYYNNYIKVDDSDNLPFWQIVCNKIASIEK